MRGHSRQDDLLMRLKHCLGTIDGANREKYERKKQFGKNSRNQPVKEWQTIGLIARNSNNVQQERAQSREASFEVNLKMHKRDQKQNYQCYREKHKRDFLQPKPPMEPPLRRNYEETQIELENNPRKVYEKYETRNRNKSHIEIPRYQAPLSKPNKYQRKRYDYTDREMSQTPKSGQFCFPSKIPDRYNDCYRDCSFHGEDRESFPKRPSSSMIETRMSQPVPMNRDTIHKLQKINELNSRINKRIESIVHNFGYNN